MNLEKTIEEIFKFFESFLSTILNLLFKPLKSLRSIERNNAIGLMDAKVFFIISLIVFIAWLFVSSAYEGYDIIALFSNWEQKLQSTSIFESLLSLVPVYIVFHLIITVLIHILRLAGYKKVVFRSWFYYWVSMSVWLYLLSRSLLHFLFEKVLHYSIGLRTGGYMVAGDWMNNIFIASFLLVLGYCSLVPLITITIQYFRTNKKLWLKLLLIPVLTFNSLFAIVILVDSLNRTFDLHNKEIVVESLDSKFAFIPIGPDSSVIKIKIPLVIKNFTDNPVYISRRTWINLRHPNDEEATDYIFNTRITKAHKLTDEDLRNTVSFSISAWQDGENKLMVIKPGELKWMMIEGKRDKKTIRDFLVDDDPNRMVVSFYVSPFRGDSMDVISMIDLAGGYLKYDSTSIPFFADPK